MQLMVVALTFANWRMRVFCPVLCAGNCNGDSTCRDDFYSDPVAVGYYKDHVNKLLNRVNVFNGRLYRCSLQFLDISTASRAFNHLCFALPSAVPATLMRFGA